jgi:hypothetical protein
MGQQRKRHTVYGVVLQKTREQPNLLVFISNVGFVARNVSPA